MRIRRASFTATRTVLRWAVASRVLVVALIVLWRSLVAPYDTSAFINPGDCRAFDGGHPSHRILLPRVAAALENSVVWDSVYFVRIAQCGYEYEQSYAFLPLLPVSIHVLSRTVFAPLIPLVGYRAVLALCGYAVSNISFIFAALSLYRLSVIILNDGEAALRASIFFCFNPASIFYSSIYSESLYALLSLGGLYHLMSGTKNLAVFLFAVSGSARSNGILNAGYIGFEAMHQAYNVFFLKNDSFLAIQVLIVGASRCLCVIVPFIAFQAYGYYNICLEHFPDRMRPWCKQRLPLLYNFIQSHYWGVGFLRYFQVKQLPNFLLAMPILSIALCSIIWYVKLWPETFFSLGFQASPTTRRLKALLFSRGAEPKSESGYFLETQTSKLNQEVDTLGRRKITVKEEDPVILPLSYSSIGPVNVLPFVLHLGFMTATAFFVMHVQVATRFLSANPPIYWFASYLMVSPVHGWRWGYLIWGYCAAYILLGSLLFSNFYPFT